MIQKTQLEQNLGNFYSLKTVLFTPKVGQFWDLETILKHFSEDFQMP